MNAIEAIRRRYDSNAVMLGTAVHRAQSDEMRQYHIDHYTAAMTELVQLAYLVDEPLAQELALELDGLITRLARELSQES